MALNDMASKWQLLGAVVPSDLKESIDLIHRGAQFISIIGHTYLSTEPDDSQTNMSWDVEKEMLVGRWVSSSGSRLRLALHSASLRLMLFREDVQEPLIYPLVGSTNAAALEWLRGQLDKAGLKGGLMDLDLHYEIPHHPTDDGAAYPVLNVKADLLAAYVFEDWGELDEFKADDIDYLIWLKFDL